MFSLIFPHQPFKNGLQDSSDCNGKISGSNFCLRHFLQYKYVITKLDCSKAQKKNLKLYSLRLDGFQDFEILKMYRITWIIPNFNKEESTTATLQFFTFPLFFVTEHTLSVLFSPLLTAAAADGYLFLYLDPIFKENFQER